MKMHDGVIFQNGDASTHLVSEVQQFYKNSHILITGVTGFLGKALAEKLLRTCPELEKLYILVREKQGKDVEARFEEIFEDPVFNIVRNELPKFKSKIVAIRGDCQEPGLGLSEEDRLTLISKINVIFHSAARVKFDEHLRIALATNTRAPLQLLEMAKQMKNIKAFMHISTIYCQPFLERIEEKVYPCDADYERLHRTVSTMSDELVEKSLPSLIGPWPNTYTFTKALAEKEMALRSGNVPLSIFRPGVVSSAASEPIKGWIDNMHGPTGFAIGCMMGVIRTFHCVGSVSAEVVPVDYVANCLMVAAVNVNRDYETSILGEPPVFNYVSSVENRMSWNDFLRHIYKEVEEHPFSDAIWFATLTYKRSKLLNEICVLLLHLLPGLLFDAISVCVGKKPKLLKTYKKIYRLSFALEYFTLRDYDFCNRSVRDMWKQTPDMDKQLYPFSMKDIDWDVYYSEYLLGCRRHLFKDGDETLPQARKRWRRLYYIHQVVRTSFLLLLAYGIWSLLSWILL